MVPGAIFNLLIVMTSLNHSLLLFIMEPMYCCHSVTFAPAGTLLSGRPLSSLPHYESSRRKSTVLPAVAGGELGCRGLGGTGPSWAAVV